MTSILFLIDTIYRSTFRCKYLENKRHFRNFFLQLKNLDSILKNFKKKDDAYIWCIFELRYSENRG